MTRIATLLPALALLAACGADGAPVKPVYTAKQTIGYNSVTGSFTRTEFGVCVGPTCD